MKPFVLLLISSLGIFVSCVNKKKNFEPLSVDTMTKILYDYQLQESMLSNHNLPSDSAWMINRFRELEVLNRYHVSDSLFILIYNYYLRDGNVLADIYSHIADSLKQSKPQASDDLKQITEEAAHQMQNAAIEER